MVSNGHDFDLMLNRSTFNKNSGTYIVAEIHFSLLSPHLVLEVVVVVAAAVAAVVAAAVAAVTPVVAAAVIVNFFPLLKQYTVGVHLEAFDS